MLARGALTGLQNQMRGLDEARTRASTGIRVQRPSDDPVAAAGIMQSSSGLRALEQYRRNLETGQARLGIEDSVLEQLGNALARAKELGLAQGSDTANQATRATAQAEVLRLVDFAKDLANTRYADAYVFGGQYADSPPFQAGAVDPARPPSGDLSMEIGTGLVVNTNHSAQEIFLDSDAVDSLQALADALGANDPDAIRAAVTRIDGAFDQVQVLVGDLGARMARFDIAMTNVEALDVNLQTFRAGLADADLARAVTDLVDRQGSLEAAMLANSRILDLALTDYL